MAPAEPRQRRPKKLARRLSATGDAASAAREPSAKRARRKTSGGASDSLAKPLEGNAQIVGSAPAIPQETVQDPCTILLRALPHGTTAKSLRTFFAEANPKSVDFNVADREATVRLPTPEAAARCAQRWALYAEALQPAGRGKRVQKVHQKSQRNSIGVPQAADGEWNKGQWTSTAESADGQWHKDSNSVQSEGVKPAKKTEASKLHSGDSEQAKERLRTKELTRQIAGFAAKRQLSRAIETFETLEKEGISPGVHAYANLLNAHGNSGDVEGAVGLFAKMRKAGVAPNVVAYTALLKGHCRVGDIPRARALLDDMMQQSPPVVPDIRAVNTFMRGCVRVGDVASAQWVFGRLGEWKLEPDPAAVKFLSVLLSQALLLKPLLGLCRRQARAGKPADAVDPGVGQEAVVAEADSAKAPCKFWAGGYCNRGKKCQFLHDPSIPQEKDKLTEQESQETQVALNLRLARCSALLGKAKSCRLALKRARRALKASSKSEPTDNSAWEHHQNCQREHRLEMNLFRRFLASGATRDLQAHLSRVFLFSPRLLETTSATRPQAAEVVATLTEELASFGLGAKEGNLDSAKAATALRYADCLSDSGTLRWPEVFGPTRAQLPVKLEVCTGQGEWVMAHAKAEEDSSNWVALELMRDRTHDVFVRAVLDDVQNICILGGDATMVLSRHVEENSVDHIFVNFPEPPHISGSEAAESHLHLLSVPFLRQLHTILRSGGRLTILSDNRRYLRTVAVSIAGLVRRGKPMLESLKDSQAKDLPSNAEDVQGIRLHCGWPGPGAGHAVTASSQFDRLWDRDSRKERYFLVVAKK